MSKVDKQALRELAEKAGVQEWGQDKGDVVALGGWPGSSGPLVLASANEYFPEHAINTAAYVAAANPATILALLDEIEALRTCLAETAGVAVTMLYESHKADTLKEFSIEELSRMVDSTKYLADANAQVEKIYRKAWDMAQGGADHG